MTITIASAAELTRALSKAQGGETFLLAPGNYGNLRLDELEFDRAVTIRSADPMNMAKFTGLEVIDSENIKFVGLDVGRAMTPREKDFGKIVTVLDSENIAFEGLHVHGTLNGNPSDDGYGLYVKGGQDVSIRNSNFTDLARGTVIDASSNLVLEGNRFQTIRTDGANFRAVNDVQIKDNWFSDFLPRFGDHSDAIQFIAHGAERASSNITITGNQIFTGAGAGPQGIFISDETGRLPYKNVVIDNNILFGADSYHGIAVLGGQSVSITNNTVLSRDDDGKNFWIKVQNVAQATISKNVTDVVIVGNGVSGLKQFDNLTLHKNDDPRERELNLGKGPQTTIDDLVLPGIGYVPNGASPAPAPAPAPPPAPVPPPPPGPTASNAIFGTSGSDKLWGTAGSDTLYGFGNNTSGLGAGTRDVLLGGGGADLFVLGDARGVFYDSGTIGAGRRDYAAIRDFGNGDKIQLAGDASDYVLKRERFGSDGVGIYIDSNRDGRWTWSDEFIAHVSGSKIPTALGAGDFVFSATTNRTSFDVPAAFTDDSYTSEATADQGLPEVPAGLTDDVFDFEATDEKSSEASAVFADDLFTFEATADHRLFEDLAAFSADYFTFG